MKAMVAVLLMMSSAVAATAQSRFTVDTGESRAHESADGQPAAALELVTGRLQFRAEIPLSASHTGGAEIGVAYNVLRSERATLFAGLDVEPADPSDLTLRFESELAFERGEIEAELTAGVGAERGVALELAGTFDDSRWRGTLDLRRESGISELRITPGVAWKVRDLWLGAGVALPSASRSNPSLVLRVIFEF